MAKIYLRVRLGKQQEQLREPVNNSPKIKLRIKGDQSKPSKHSLDDIEKEINNNSSAYEKSAKSFFNSYLNSPLYKQRLIKQGYNNTQETINERIKNLNSTTPVLRYGGNTGYLGGSKKIELDPTTFQLDANSKLKNSFGHEYSHAAGAINPQDAYYSKQYTNPGMNENDYNEILKRNKLNKIKGNNLLGHMRSIYSSIDPKIVGQNMDSFYEHDISPSESKADIDALRFMLYNDKLYDAGKQKFTKDILERAKLKYTDTQSKRLFKNFSDDDIIWMMNNIALNKKEDGNMA